jgi:hypothetical protein
MTSLPKGEGDARLHLGFRTDGALEKRTLFPGIKLEEDPDFIIKYVLKAVLKTVLKTVLKYVFLMHQNISIQ